MEQVIAKRLQDSEPKTQGNPSKDIIKEPKDTLKITKAKGGLRPTRQPIH